MRLLPSAGTLLRDLASVSGPKGPLAVAYAVAGALLEGVGISLLVPLFSLVFGAHAIPGWLGRCAAYAFGLAGVGTPLSRLLLILGLFCTLMVLRAAVISGREVAVAKVQNDFIRAQRLRITQKLAAANWPYIARLRHSRITHIMSGDIERLGFGIWFVLRGATASVMLVAQCLLALFLAPVPAAIVLPLMAGGMFLLSPMLVRARLHGALVADANLSLLDSTAQFLGGLKLAISQNLETGFVEETSQILRRLSDRQIDYIRQRARGQAVLTALPALLGAALVLAGFGLFHIPASVLITLLLVITRMFGPLDQIQQGAQQFAQVLAIYEKLQELANELSSARRDTHGASSSEQVRPPSIVFDGVSFQHAGVEGDAAGGASLRNFGLTIAPGEFLGITGASGAGKTTFADLLVGLYSPQTGRIVVDGTTLQGAALAGWRNSLSYVSQDPFLFHDTIRRNFSWACAQAHEDDMWRALAMAGAQDLVRRMQDGLDTIVGERGTLVSGGERQRITLARALLRRPKLLVLDEATGAIDSDGEREIFARLRDMPERPTIVLIAHRTDNLSACDRIIRFEPK